MYKNIPYNISVDWTVGFTKKAAKQAAKLKPKLQDTLKALMQEMMEHGPVRGDWPNYSKLPNGSHRCHLSYDYVACWRVVDNQIKIIEVYYAGSRKDAPYD